MLNAKIRRAVPLRKITIDQLQELKDTADRAAKKVALYESLSPELFRNKFGMPLLKEFTKNFTDIIIYMLYKN